MIGRHVTEVFWPFSQYCLTCKHSTAFGESSIVCGLNMLPEDSYCPMHNTDSMVVDEDFEEGDNVE